ncbi:MAG: CPBP family intramembrane metalloprotease [Chloroflexi bacterium]|nr:CPBP family intramembrane metalloprotease [Chloroflexota bacterium]
MQRETFLKRPLAYFLLTLAISWGCLFAAIASGQPMGASPTTLLFYLGAGGPFIVGTSLALFAHGKTYRQTYLRRVVDVKRIRGAWWLVIGLLFPALNLTAMGLAQLSGLARADFSAACALLADPLGLLSSAVFLFFFGPLPEELGWRGYAQERLIRRVSPLAASLITGAVWAAWHVPMYLIPGTYQHQWGFLSSIFWIRSASIVLEAVILGWVFTQTDSSTLSAILMHFAVNFSGELLELPPAAEWIRLGLVAVVVILVVVRWKAGRRKPAQAAQP